MQKKAAGKKASFFPVGAAMGRQCYCSAGLIDSDSFWNLDYGINGLPRFNKI